MNLGPPKNVFEWTLPKVFPVVPRSSYGQPRLQEWVDCCGLTQQLMVTLNSLTFPYRVCEGLEVSRVCVEKKTEQLYFE